MRVSGCAGDRYNTRNFLPVTCRLIAGNTLLYWLAAIDPDMFFFQPFLEERAWKGTGKRR